MCHLFYLHQVYSFFQWLNPSDESKYEVFNVWRGPIRPTDPFFIRVGTLEVDRGTSIGIGVERPEETSGELVKSMKITGQSYNYHNNAAWWYVSMYVSNTNVQSSMVCKGFCG